MAMGNATQEFMVGDRVRYVGLTVMHVPAGTEGEVVRPSERYGKHMYWVKFPGYVDLACWPAELERVDPYRPGERVRYIGPTLPGLESGMEGTFTGMEAHGWIGVLLDDKGEGEFPPHEIERVG